MTDEVVINPPYTDIKAWKEEYQPGMPNPEDHDFGNVTKAIPELLPERYYNKYFGGIDATSGYFYYESDGHTKLDPPVKATDEQYREAMRLMNFYENGGKTPAGREGGLDPRKLLDGVKTEVDGFDDKVVQFPNGAIYDYSHAPNESNDMKGVNATYRRSASSDPEWEGDMYSGRTYNPDWAGVYPA